MHKLTYKHTIATCCIGYISQSFINFVPLLYAFFSNKFNLSLTQITMISSVCFITQIVTDLVFSRLLNVIGYRACAILSHVLAVVGLIVLSFITELISPFVGLLIATVLYSTGIGLTEVVISPIVEACPTKNKARAMGFLHSFYAWGSVIVILSSTAFFNLFGIENWQTLSRLFCIIPLINTVFFCFVPIYTIEQSKGNTPVTDAQKTPKGLFFLFMVLMVSAGATELAVCTWASDFAEAGLHLSKTLGDLVGPALFAFLLGVSRIIYAFCVKPETLKKFLFFSACGCVASFLIIIFSPAPIFNLIGCGVCGIFVGILWPGVYSLASSTLLDCKSSTFGILAFSGDVGCFLGPSVVGFMSDAFNANMKIGFAFSLVFPLLAVLGMTVLHFKKRPVSKQ